MLKFRWKTLAIDLAFGWYNAFTKPGTPVTDVVADQPLAALAEYYDAVWVLTIPRNTKRQEFIRQQLTGLPFEFITGVDGKSLVPDDPRFDLVQARERVGRNLVINELACTMSHLVMYQKILDEGLNRVLIFEDDAFFDTRKSRWIIPILRQLPADWELLYWGYRDGELRGLWWEFKERFGWKRPEGAVASRTVHRGLRTAAGHDFTHAYAVTREGARKLLEGAYPVRQTADGLLEDKVLAGEIRAYAAVPKVFLQLEDLGSSIHQ